MFRGKRPTTSSLILIDRSVLNIGTSFTAEILIWGELSTNKPDWSVARNV